MVRVQKPVNFLYLWLRRVIKGQGKAIVRLTTKDTKPRFAWLLPSPHVVLYQIQLPFALPTAFSTWLLFHLLGPVVKMQINHCISRRNIYYSESSTHSSLTLGVYTTISIHALIKPSERKSSFSWPRDQLLDLHFHSLMRAETKQTHKITIVKF